MGYEMEAFGFVTEEQFDMLDAASYMDLSSTIECDTCTDTEICPEHHRSISQVVSVQSIYDVKGLTKVNFAWIEDNLDELDRMVAKRQAVVKKSQNKRSIDTLETEIKDLKRKLKDMVKAKTLGATKTDLEKEIEQKEGEIVFYRREVAYVKYGYMDDDVEY
jgi:hypothetical protein